MSGRSVYWQTHNPECYIRYRQPSDKSIVNGNVHEKDVTLTMFSNSERYCTIL